jgi:hypothetical protein
MARLFGGGAPELEVSNTRIFARVEAATQFLVYAMSLAAPVDVAMVLPLPVSRARGESALSFIDLSAYPKFFDDMAELFPMAEAKSAFLLSRAAPQAAKTLVVHSVGSFEASFVPTPRDFSRLDPRFRLPESVLGALPQYADYGFAVFKLKKGKRAEIHPMAMRFDSSDPSVVFFPTVHAHDGSVHRKADFGHSLYYQAAKAGERSGPGTGTYRASDMPAGEKIDMARAQGLVEADALVHAWDLHGQFDNCDALVRIADPARHAA